MKKKISSTVILLLMAISICYSGSLTRISLGANESITVRAAKEPLLVQYIYGPFTYKTTNYTIGTVSGLTHLSFIFSGGGSVSINLTSGSFPKNAFDEDTGAGIVVYKDMLDTYRFMAQRFLMPPF